ncbi:head GIN domain-containing protein [Undibacterium aquatile]|uniref:DUF2807 domain-containing protein n=1 Tax=Undibacterium aquatile TaxID=1537398 RepID=A0ABR6XHQ3_9BURK|nr:head GIN domain-containing protein [Undibacterium aquatile]MBC3812432.1 DUF2807 domain-containing protein [Undibacterium aquatile]
MKYILRTGAGMLVLAIILTAASAFFMQAHAATTLTEAAAGNFFSGDSNDTRPVTAQVTQVVLSGPIDLLLRSSVVPSLSVRGDPKLASRVTTRVDGNTLYITTRGIFITLGKSESVRVELNLPVLEKLQLSGSGDVNVKGFKGKRLEFSMRGSGDLIFDGDFTQIQGAMNGSGDLNLSLANSEQVTLSMQGSGDAMLKGQSAALTVKLSGSGDLHAEALKAKQVFIESRGSADSKIFATEEVNARLMGSGDLSVKGNPLRRNAERLGSGDIIWR